MRQHTGRTIDVAIVGAGPYGLSLAAHLDALGMSFRIFGKPLETWRNHMPRTMQLKSEGLASSLSAPKSGSRLEDFCATNGLAYQSHDLPIPLEQFNAYASRFAERFVPMLEDTLVTSVTRGGDDFALTLATGETLTARKVVLAVGITSYAYTPEVLSDLPATAFSHSFDHRSGEQFKDRDVVVLGGGSSAIDTAAMLQDCGANVTILARGDAIRYHTAPDPKGERLINKLHKPPTGIGPGWRSFFCVHLPQLFHRLPQAFRLEATRKHLGPAPGWFMRARIEGRIPTFLRHTLNRATWKDGRVALDVTSPEGARTLACDHVVSATGYRVNVDRLTWLAPELAARIATVEKTPILSLDFETSVKGLYFVGPSAANSFGPLMRFMVGSEFAAPRLAKHLHRKLAGSGAKAWTPALQPSETAAS